MSTPPLPQPQLDRTQINFEQYFEYTPEKPELWGGFTEILLSSAKNLIKRGYLTCEGA
jgi:hypothetical protein